MTRLFPYDEKELIEIWKRLGDMRKDRPEIALMFGTLFCVTVSAGMRSGEIRALYRERVSIVVCPASLYSITRFLNITSYAMPHSIVSIV
ncbi:MAG: hypothetical protein LBB61_09395 [Treponema sp.]|nr:hypothetical protein [Treponema sp.]